MNPTLFKKMYGILATVLNSLGANRGMTLSEVYSIALHMQDFIDENFVPSNRKVDLPHTLLLAIAADSFICNGEFMTYSTVDGNASKHKIEAIKHLRSITDCSLKAAKNAVEEAYNWKIDAVKPVTLDELRQKLTGGYPPNK